MSMRHLWIRTRGIPVPARWTEAFPAGEVVDVRQLLSRADILHMTWLAAADGRWAEDLRQILTALPSARVVVLSSSPDDKEALRAVAAGARGYAHTHAVPAMLQELALVVEHGGYWLGPGPLRLLREHGLHAMAEPHATKSDANWKRLSAREADVAHAVQEGHSNKEIARLLGITERTVKAHLGAAYEKLGVRGRLQLGLRLSAPVPPSNRNATRSGLP